MIKRLIILSLAFVPFAIYRHLGDFVMPVTQKTEAWLESSVPVAFGEYELVTDDAGKRVTYKMDKQTYDVLSPVGITGQVFRDREGRNYDAVIIAGLGMHSFHDQRWCFEGQGFQILSDKTTTINTKAYGDVEVMSLTLKRDGRPAQPALFVFKSPTRFSTNYHAAKFDFVIKQLMTARPHMGFSFRFIGMTEDMTEAQMTKFAAEFMDNVHETSKGDI